jgi:hypothetical protein
VGHGVFFQIDFVDFFLGLVFERVFVQGHLFELGHFVMGFVETGPDLDIWLEGWIWCLVWKVLK